MTQPDPKALAQARFAKPDSLLTGLEILQRYATDPPQVVRTLLDAVRPGAPDARICELGFGTGWLIEEMAGAFPHARIVGLDMSAGMAGHVQELLGRRVPLVQGDMERLPFADESFDVVVTCWTLYFMSDIDAALVEIKRTLRPGGRLVAATVAPDHSQELDEIAAAALRAALGREAEPDIGRRFDTESGAPYIERHFDGVRLVEHHGELVLPDPGLPVRLWDQWRPQDLSDDEVERVRAEVVRLANEVSARDGAFRVRRHGGVFVGHKPS